MPKRTAQPPRDRTYDNETPPVLRQLKKFVLGSAPGHLFRRLDSRAQAVFQKHTKAVALTPRQFGVLVTVYQTGPMHQAALSQAVAIDKSTLGEMTKRMVAKDLLWSKADENDKRAVSIGITEKGVTTLVKIIDAVQISQRELLAPLPEECHLLFLSWLKALVKDDVV
jgi:DNA-binding MarR family transcriptional regulator